MIDELKEYVSTHKLEEKPLLEDVIDWGQGNDDHCTEIIEAFNKFRDGYYDLCSFSDSDWWEFMNQDTAFNNLMKREWDKLEFINFMEIMERMAIILSGGYTRYNKFAEGVKECYKQRKERT